MLRISRKMRAAGKRRNPSAHQAASIISYMGILKHCDSYNFKTKWVYPNINIRKYKGVIRNETRRIQQHASHV